MKKFFKNILIVDDHPLIADSYKNFLHKLDLNCCVTICYCLDEAYKVSERMGERLDLAIVDWQFTNIGKNNNTEDFIKFLKKTNGNCNIAVITSLTEGIIIYDIYKKLSPNSILIKSEVTEHDFLCALKTVYHGEKYFSPFVKKTINFIATENYYLDNYNRQILLFLAKGIMTKNLTKFLPLSTSSIDKRKSILKTLLASESCNDEELLQAARERGLVN
jgi:DNA-binding NarL/FixJ family response regulator